MEHRKLAFSRVCSLCGNTQIVEIPKTSKHIWDDWEVTRNATIKRTGQKRRVCWECDAVQKKTIAKLKPYARFVKKTYSVTAGKKVALKLKYARGDKYKKWTTSNSRVAVVSAKGSVTAKAAGTARITVKLKSGKKATCKVVVKAKKVVVPKASTATRSAAAAPASSSAGTVYWTPGGSVYHISRWCSTLRRSRTVYSGSVSASGKPRPCKVCS